MSHFKERILNELKQVDRQGMPKLMKYLQESDFFTAPASTKHHDSEAGGLAYHSWTVFRLLKQKNEAYNLQLHEDTVRITGLLHDMCKIYYYELGKKWVKNAETGWKWVQEDTWLVEDQFPIGHGEKSVIVLQRYIRLTDREALMIRYHMGAFDPMIHFYPSKYAFSDAIEACPAIVALASADWESRIVSNLDVES